MGRGRLLVVKFRANIASAESLSLFAFGSDDVTTLFDVPLEIRLSLINILRNIFQNGFGVKTPQLLFHTDDFSSIGIE